MKNGSVLSFLFFYFFILQASAQPPGFCTFFEEEGGYLMRGRVTAPSGLNVRSAPGIAYTQVMGKLPFGKVVYVCVQGEEEEIDGKKDHWYRVRSGELDGFVFGAYLELEKTPLEIHIPPFGVDFAESGENSFDDDYLVLVAPPKLDSYHQIKLEENYLQPNRLKKIGQLQPRPDPVTALPDSIVGFFKGSPFQEGLVYGMSPVPRTLFPGDEILVHLGDAKYSFFATGQPVRNEDPLFPNYYSHLSDYTLQVRSGETTQTLIRLPRYKLMGDPTLIHLHWLGDLDGDQKLDVILLFCDHYAAWAHWVFLSSLAEKGELLLLAAIDGKVGC